MTHPHPAATRAPHPRIPARPIVAIACALVALAASGTQAADATDTDPGRWVTPLPHTATALSTPDRELAGAHRDFYDVAAVATDDVWAVGNGGEHLVTRATHYDGHTWSPTNPPGQPLSELWGVTALTDGTVWAVGNEQGSALTLHRLGATWLRVSTPPPYPDQRDTLTAIDAVSPTDIWAVGYSTTEALDFKPLIMHYNGDTWSKVPYELPYGNHSGLLDGVTVIGRNDVWAAGDTWGNQRAPLMLHWDGTSWTPNTDLITAESALFGLDDIDAAGPDDVWAVGAAHHAAAIIHWDGHLWTQVAPPKRSHAWFIDRLWGVHATSPDDVWAVGGRGDRSFPEKITVLHWNGHRWTKQKTPNPGAKSNQLWDIDATGPNDVWAVGAYANDDTTTRHLVLHYDGHRWTRSR